MGGRWRPRGRKRDDWSEGVGGGGGGGDRELGQKRTPRLRRLYIGIEGREEKEEEEEMKRGEEEKEKENNSIGG